MDAIPFDGAGQAVETATAYLAGRFALAAAVFAALLLGGRLLAGMLRRAARRNPRNAPLLGMLARGIWIAALAVGILSGLQNLGVDVSAFVAGLLIIAYKPFVPGDRIAVQGVEGAVLAIDLRYTTLEGQGRIHLIPNSVVLTSPVTVIGGGG